MDLYCLWLRTRTDIDKPNCERLITTKKSNIERRTRQIIKRGKTYLVRVFLYQESNGKKHYYIATVKGTRKDADDHLTEYLQKKNTGKLKQKSSDKRFGEFLEEYFTNISTAKRRSCLIDLGKAFIEKIVGALFNSGISSKKRLRTDLTKGKVRYSSKEK